MSNDKKIVFEQSRQTKLGMAGVKIWQTEDLYEAEVIIAYKDTVFKAEGIFSSAREAFLWSYGVKQTRNDRYAGYTAKEGNLIETKPAKNKVADIISVKDALVESQDDYDNFELSKASKASDKISLSSVKTSTLLTEEEKTLMESLFSKMGKGQVNHA